jgi:NitT/TauT family transport system permease protein
MTVASEQTATAPTGPSPAGTPSEASGGWRQSQAFQKWLPRMLGYVVVLGFWQYASGRLVDPHLLPSPTMMVQEMREIIETGQFLLHFGSTLRKLAIGLAIAFVVGACVGILMARPWADAFFRDWVVGIMNTPGLIFALIAAIIFGFAAVGPIIAIVVTSFPFITVNIAEGVKALPKDLIDMGKAFHVAERRRLRQIVIPFLAPYTFAAVRYGFSIAWKIATLTEVFGGGSGIGVMLRTEQQRGSILGMLAWIFFFFAFAIVLEALLQLGMKRYFRWRPEAVAF